MLHRFVVVFLAGLTLLSAAPVSDPRLAGAFREPAKNGWTFVHLEGDPYRIGFQNGFLLSAEIAEFQKVVALELSHDTKKPWSFFRATAEKDLWPLIEQEYRDELRGIAEGVQAEGVKLDLWDIVVLNAWLELGYYNTWYDKQQGQTSKAVVPERCSAFVATGSYTKDGKVVIAHNAWTGYMDGRFWTIVYDIVPTRGHRILMDGLPGLIHSGDDFGLNSAGIAITETTISNFAGWDPKGIPEFVRARKAMQYSQSIDDFIRIMSERNNGGYANNWLVADRKTNEICSLELGLKNVNALRSFDGYFCGANFPVNQKLLHEETEFPAGDISVSGNARKKRWEQLMAENKSKIDVAAAQRFMSDHFDTYQGKVEPNERTLCGHIDQSPRGLVSWQPPYGIAGAVQSKVADAGMMERMSFAGSAGHACGTDFKASDHLAQHPEFAWQKEYLRDLKSQPWTTFSIAKDRQP
ncbi:MAG: peptidase C45 [Acidobacteria bacterium]|nr:MAG: peptidase C45 [Acidobacteriota bacterium]